MWYWLKKHQPNPPSKAISIDVFPDPLKKIITDHKWLCTKHENSPRSDDQIDTMTLEQLLAIDMKPECPVGWRWKPAWCWRASWRATRRINRPRKCGIIESNIVFALDCRWDIDHLCRRICAERVQQFRLVQKFIHAIQWNFGWKTQLWDSEKEKAMRLEQAIPWIILLIWNVKRYNCTLKKLNTVILEKILEAKHISVIGAVFYFNYLTHL